MITLRSHSLRSFLRAVTLLTALTSLVLAMLATAALPALARTEHCPGANEGNAPPLPAGWQVVTPNPDGAVEGSTLTLPAGTYFCVKGSNDASGILPMGESGTWTTPTDWTPSDDGPAISYFMIYTPPTPLQGSATVLKAWTGDRFDDTGVTVTFTATIDGVTSFSMHPGDSQTLQLGQTLTITDELVTGLPANCAYQSDLGDLGEGASFTATTAAPVGTITVTNDVDCQDTNEGRGSVAKDWEGAQVPLEDVTVTFTANVDDDTSFEMKPGDSRTLQFGQTLTITDELVTGLPERCEYESDLGDSASFTATADDPDGTITITNVVTCTPPPPPPLTGTGSVAKAWGGEAISLDGVSVTFTANVDNGASFEMKPGDSRTLRLGQTLTITDELVTGLPDNCSYESSLPDDASFTATSTNRTGTITVTNDVTCVADEVVGSATVTKAWTGAAFDDTDLTVSFTAVVDDGAPFTMQPGDVEPLLVDQTLTITDEKVTGLPEGCTYESSLPDGGLSFTATEGTPVGTLEITNDVTCGGVAPETVVNVRLDKVWDVDDPEDELDTTTIDVAFTVTGYPRTFEPGDVLVATPGDVLEVSERTGTLPARCELTDVLAAPYTVTDATDQVLTVTNVVACAEVEGVVVTLPRTGLATGTWAMVASLLAAAGALLLLATREEPTGRRG